ncbi:hypothetical protein [Micromonospora thermarum]|uniref:Uncharacterized protein n=1 Tax=Micromonospora thermarum TaxID=2720024 RepID=A0ABX0Z759_9ACTN|nr:hypothetical protein [Micromonospora thermarum]NJP33686.1 hypothetical protein [Micromonospora thermarum]
MTTTEEILAALTVEREAHAAAGDAAEVARAEQQISAHHALAALRTEQAALRAAGDAGAADALDVLIRFWRRQVDVEPAAAGEPGGEPAATPALPSRRRR